MYLSPVTKKSLRIAIPGIAAAALVTVATVLWWKIILVIAVGALCVWGLILGNSE